MEYRSILYNWKFRISFAILSGIIFKLLVDIIFGLIYRNYEVLKPWNTYVGIILTNLVLVECFLWVTKRLDAKTNWNQKPRQRFFKQLSYHLVLLLLFFGFFRWIVEFMLSDSYFIILKNEIIILSATLIIAVFFNVFELGLFLLNKWRFSLAEIERFKKENAEFQFEMLRNQVNPHFLFNSLTTLSSIMYENVDTAAHYIRRLAEVYRYVLESRQKELISLEKEIQFIEAYKYLFELRFADKIKFHIEISKKDMEKLIAPMTLQMLVENAVKHNVVSSKKPLQIAIYSLDNAVVVSHNFQPKTPEGFSSGMGLKNIQSQYAYLTNRPIEVENTEADFTVKVPLINNQEPQK